jgi:PAS domain S-box-containing protein
MAEHLRILIVDDSPDDAELIVRELRRSGFTLDWERVDTEDAMLARLHVGLDLVLSDYKMPLFSELRALELVKQSGLDLPFIIVSGTIGEDMAVETMRLGATDYLLKDRLARLGVAVTHAVSEGQLRRERRQAESVLKESNRRFQEMLENVSLIAVTLDMEGMVTFCNDYLLRLTGWTREEVIGRSWRECFLPGRDAGTGEALFENVHAGTVTPHHRNYIKTKEGELRDIVWNNTTLRDGVGTAVGTASIGEDVTERSRAETALRESEALFRQVVENIHEVFWVTDIVKSRMVYVSPGYEAIWGRTCESLYAEPWTWASSIFPEDRDRVLHAAAQRQVHGDYDEIYRILRPDGSVRWIRDRAFPIRDAQGQVFRIVGTAEDVTEYRKLEEQFRHAQKMEAIGALAGGIAHDFNNILAGITGYAELSMTDPTCSPQIGEFLGEIMKGSRRAAELVHQILAFGRRQEQHRAPIDLSRVLREALKLLRATIPATIDFDIVFREDTPTVLADATQIHQIMMNLGTNAAHAMRERLGRLTVRLEPLAVDAELADSKPGLRAGRYALLTVGDTGHGMDAATLARIFEPFFTTKAPGEGTGLGLAAVHGIMASHEGVISVYSQPGEGATFHLYFPAHAGEAAAAAAAPGAVPRGNGERILYVDDEPALARLGQRVLERLGYAVEAHTKAAEALGALRGDPGGFHLVVTDQMMPELTGTDLALKIHAIRPGIPIILTTGYTASLTPERLHLMGISRLLMKPLSVESLGTLVHDVLTENRNKEIDASNPAR